MQHQLTKTFYGDERCHWTNSKEKSTSYHFSLVDKLIVSFKIRFHYCGKNILRVFIFLYNIEYIKHNKLILIDEDSADYEQVINAIKTTKAHSNSTNICCALHARRKKFNGLSYP